MVFWFTLTRILHFECSTVLEVTRKFLLRSKSKFSAYFVRETSPLGLQHVHVLIACPTLEDKWRIESYIDTHRLKAYIDGYKDIVSPDRYLGYIRKSIVSPFDSLIFDPLKVGFEAMINRLPPQTTPKDSEDEFLD